MISKNFNKHNKFLAIFACFVATTLALFSCVVSKPESNGQKKQVPLKKVSIEISLKKSILIETEIGAKKLIGYQSIVLEPSLIDIELYSGWNRENEANKDKDALAFISGPTFELTQDLSPDSYTVHGDIKGKNGLFKSKNKAAASERGFISINSKGQANFGYGNFSDALSKETRVFIGGLHVITNHTVARPITYKGILKMGFHLQMSGSYMDYALMEG